MVESIMAAYDDDESGNLGKTELAPMLNDYSIQIFGKSSQPSHDDVDFLFSLCDCDASGSKGQIDRDEVLAVTEAWCLFLKQKDQITKLRATHDQDGNFQIERSELQDLLEDVNCGEIVPGEVTDWVLKQSDLSQNGELGEMELVRALAVFELWQNQFDEDAKQADPNRLVQGAHLDTTLPPPAQPRLLPCCPFSVFRSGSRPSRQRKADPAHCSSQAAQSTEGSPLRSAEIDAAGGALDSSNCAQPHHEAQALVSIVPQLAERVDRLGEQIFAAVVVSDMDPGETWQLQEESRDWIIELPIIA